MAFEAQIRGLANKQFAVERRWRFWFLHGPWRGVDLTCNCWNDTAPRGDADYQLAVVGSEADAVDHVIRRGFTKVGKTAL